MTNKQFMSLPVVLFLALTIKLWWLVSALGIALGLYYDNPEMVILAGVQGAVGLSVHQQD